MVTTCQSCQLTFDARPEAPRCPRCGVPAAFPGVPSARPTAFNPPLPQAGPVVQTVALDPALVASAVHGEIPPPSASAPWSPGVAPMRFPPAGGLQAHPSVQGDPSTRLTLSIVLSVLAFLGACVNPVAPMAIIVGIMAYSAAQGADANVAQRRARGAFRWALAAVCITLGIWVALAAAWGTGAFGS